MWHVINYRFTVTPFFIYKLLNSSIKYLPGARQLSHIKIVHISKKKKIGSAQHVLIKRCIVTKTNQTCLHRDQSV